MGENEKEEKKYEKISAYKTTDGELFEKEINAINYQQYLDNVFLLDELIHQECTYGMNKEDVKIFIMENKKKLLDILDKLNLEN